MRAYRRIGGHSWSQPIIELLHKLGRGIPLTLIAEERGALRRIERFVTKEEPKGKEDPHIMNPNKLSE